MLYHKSIRSHSCVIHLYTDTDFAFVHSGRFHPCSWVLESGKIHMTKCLPENPHRLEPPTRSILMLLNGIRVPCI